MRLRLTLFQPYTQENNSNGEPFHMIQNIDRNYFSCSVSCLVDVCFPSTVFTGKRNSVIKGVT